jgi:ubiquinone/menaquinone biosynthesis C-methylase UbiE
MGLYQRYVVPRLIDLSCSGKPVRKQREKIVPAAEGRVLEVGVGSGLNFPHYDPAKVERVFGLDPSGPLIEKAAGRATRSGLDVEFIPLRGEEIPLEDNSVDTVLVTYTLCTIDDLAAAFDQMRRVLVPNGKLLFCEHGRAPDSAVRKWQDRLNPVWRVIGGGCNLNRNIPKLIGDNGFRIDSMDVMYLPGTPKFTGYNFWGTARVS